MEERVVTVKFVPDMLGRQLINQRMVDCGGIPMVTLRDSPLLGHAWLLKALEEGKVDPGQRIVCTVTGNGLKDPDWAVAGAPQPVTVPIDADTAAEHLGLA